MRIEKAPETMTPKDRVMATFAHAKTDRVPINYYSNPGIDRRLKEALGFAPDDSAGLADALGVDFRWIGPAYKGPNRFGTLPDRHINPELGIRTRWIEHPSGGYWDYCDFPLQNATLAEVEGWPLASPDDYDYASLRDRASTISRYAVFYGSAGLGDIINSTGMLRSMEQVLVDLMTDDAAGLRLIDRKLNLQLEVMSRSLEKLKGLVDFVWMGEDLGTQIAPLISLDLFRNHIRPRHQKVIDLARSHGLPVIIHTCGSSSWAYDDFLEMGIRGVDTLQPEAANMAPAYLKRRFGGKLMFHGCISTAGPLACGTPSDVQLTVRQTLEIMTPGGGYCLSPTHQIQDNSPVENVIAMYQAAHRYGVLTA